VSIAVPPVEIRGLHHSEKSRKSLWLFRKCEESIFVSRWLLPRQNTDFRPAGVSPALGGQPQPLNPFQNRPEQFLRDRHLRHLEDHLPGMAHDLRPDLDHFLPKRRQRPVTHRSGQHSLPQEVAQVVRQHEQLQPHLVVYKVVTGQSGSFDGVLAFLDPLLRRAPLVVEPHHPFGWPAQIGHDEPDAREQFAVVPLPPWPPRGGRDAQCYSRSS